MNKSTLGLLGVLACQSVVLPGAMLSAVPDLTVKTRRSYDLQNASISTTIVYLKGERRRSDTIVDFSTQVGTSVTHMSVDTQISQCDERRMVLLNDEARTYAFLPLEDPGSDSRRAQRAVRRPPSPEPAGGDVTVTFDAVDTGERRTMGRYIARHVITTTTTAPGPGASTRRSNRQQDGWYVDLPSANCSDPGSLRASALLVNGRRSDAPQDRVHLKNLGTAPRGFPIEETDQTTDEQGTITAKIELVEFSEALLDDSLFTVPEDYRPALPGPFGGFDLTKPDTTVNRLQSYWTFLRMWLRAG